MDLPQIKDAIEFAKDRPEYCRLLVSRESFQSYEPPPLVPNTERFLLPRKHEVDYDFRQPFKRLGFFSILRYIFPRFTIRPDGAYLRRHEWWRGACALLAATVFPGYTYLELQWPKLYFVALLLDLCAYFDILQRMLVGYFNAEGALVFHPASTTAHYLKGTFIIDLLACLPLENLESPLFESSQDSQRTRSRQFLMLNRLLQLYRLRSAMLCLDGYIERRDLLLVIKAIPLYIVILNTMTSLIVFASVGVYGSEGGTWTIIPFEDEGGSWIHLFGNTFRFNLTESPWNLHLASYFWSVYATTTTGYGCFQPSNLYIIIILFVGMVLSSMITTYLSVRIISVRAKVNKQLAAYQEHMKDIVVFMRRENLPKNLQKEVLDYYEYNWEKTGGIDYTTVLKLCDQITLRTDAILHIYGQTFEKCPFLADCDVSLLRIIGRAVRSTYLLRDMILVDRDDVISDLYFVDEGVLAVKDSTSSSSTVAVLTKGSVFGNLDNLPAVRCYSAITTQSMVHVLHINAVTFHQIISDFPQVAKDLEAFRSGQENFIMGRMDDDSMSSKEQTMSSMMLFLSHHKRLSHFFYKDKYVHLYLLLVSLTCVYADVYNAGFQHNTTSFVAFLYALDVCFYVKILLFYALPYLAKSIHTKEALIPIRQSYMKNGFKYDLVSCVPIELSCFAFQKYRWMVFSWLRLNRMFRIVTAYKCLSRHRERIIINLMLSTVLTVLIWFTLIIHTMVCMWHFIGVLEDNATPNSSWMYQDDGSSWCHNMYICSMYFVLTTFTQNGVGDIMPKNQPEVIFVSMMQIVAMLLYMIFVGEFSNMIQFRLFRCFSFYSKYLELQEFLKNNRVSKNLVSMVNKYSLHLWRESRGMQVPYFLQSAPQGLRLRIMTATYMHHLEQNPVFKECETAFLRQLVGCLQLYTYDEGLYVVRKTEITDSMYMIHNGRVQKITSNPVEGRLYGSSECFGLEQGLFYDTPYLYSYRTVIKSQVLTLSLGDWDYLLKHFPKTKNTIYKYFKRDDDSTEHGNKTGYNTSDDKSNINKLRYSYDKTIRTEHTDYPPKSALNSEVANISTLDSNLVSPSSDNSLKRKRDKISILPGEITQVSQINEKNLITSDKTNDASTVDMSIISIKNSIASDLLLSTSKAVNEYYPELDKSSEDLLITEVKDRSLSVQSLPNQHDKTEMLTDKNELKESLSNIPTTSRRLRDVEESLTMPSTFIKRLETKVKELFGEKKNSITYVKDVISEEDKGERTFLKELSDKFNLKDFVNDNPKENKVVENINLSGAKSAETLVSQDHHSILTIKEMSEDKNYAMVTYDKAKQFREEDSSKLPEQNEFNEAAKSSRSLSEPSLRVKPEKSESESDEIESNKQNIIRKK